MGTLSCLQTLTIVRDVWFTGDVHDLIQCCCKEAAQTQVSGVIFLIRLPLSVYINEIHSVVQGDPYLFKDVLLSCKSVDPNARS